MNKNIFLIGLIVGIVFINGCIQQEKSTPSSVDTIKGLEKYLDSGVLHQPQSVILQGVIPREATKKSSICGKRYFLYDATGSIRLEVSNYKGVIDDYLDKNVEVSGELYTDNCENICCTGFFINVKTIKIIQQKISTKTEQSIKIPEYPTNLETSAPAPPADQALAEITIISQNNDELKIRVDKIRDYIRYPNAKNPELKEGEEISVYVNGFLDTFESRGPVCPPGYIKSPKPAGAQPIGGESFTRPIPKIVAGGKYLSKLLGCFAELNCERLGWSGYLYNPISIVVEHECVTPGPIHLPSTDAEQYPLVEPQK